MSYKVKNMPVAQTAQRVKDLIERGWTRMQIATTANVAKSIVYDMAKTDIKRYSVTPTTHERVMGLALTTAVPVDRERQLRSRKAALIVNIQNMTLEAFQYFEDLIDGLRLIDRLHSAESCSALSSPNRSNQTNNLSTESTNTRANIKTEQQSRTRHDMEFT